ncbi:uncharacterized protein LOC120293888 [Eucalyptus grandis]|uniref:uncharacterized protein LOC120293888 n=1 Tax=Eucalyptus grandis TaxID=71139 RepID=UPI00192EDF41|nr:uncharacterized protein LOC120293888 [Eucalyptus grandis]
MGTLCGPLNREEPKTVASYINTAQNAWNIQLLNHTFDEHIVKEILAIKLWPASTEHKLVWTETVDGQYTVNSAYHFIQKSEATQIVSCPSSSYITPSHLWKQIWKTKTAPKIRIFLWSLSHNAVPTNYNLFRRRITNDPFCILCSTHSPETTEHLFLQCPWTQHIWHHPNVQINVTAYATHCIDAWLTDISQQKGNVPDFETIAALLWQIWKARNHVIFRHHFTHPDQLVESALALTHLHITVQKQQSKQQPKTGKKSPNPNTTWLPPLQGMIKVNIYGAFPIAENLGAISSITRDHTGSLLGGFTKSVPATSALATEIQAFLYTLKDLLQQGKHHSDLIIETDCLILVEVINHERLPLWEDILPSFSNLKVHHCRRSANALADWAAKAHGRGSLSPTWASSPPPPLLDLICNEALLAGCTLFPT